MDGADMTKSDDAGDRPSVTLTLDAHGHVVVAGTAARADALMLARGAIGGAWRDDAEILQHYGVHPGDLDVMTALMRDIRGWW